MAAADVDDALAADIICSLRGADLGGWTPPWSKPPQEASGDGELIWPVVARGKRSRRPSPVAAAAVAGKGRWARASPASPLDYSAGSGSGASTSDGEDGGFCSPGNRRVGPPAPATKVASIGQPHLTFSAPPPRPAGQRPRKKMRLPEVQQLVRSLAVENKSLREEMQVLQRGCDALSKENDELEARLDQSATWKDQNSKGKQHVDEQSVTQSPQDSFALPDLNLPAQDVADGFVH